MTEQELHSKAAKLESLINEFRIVNPAGAVKGSFGKLEIETTNIEERISNLERSIAEFNLTGDGNVQVAGNFDSGFIVNVKC